MTELVSLFMWGLIPLVGLIFIPQTVGYWVYLYEERNEKMRDEIRYWDRNNWADGFIITILIGLGVAIIMLMGMLMKMFLGIPPFI